jgi:hypothetical protein
VDLRLRRRELGQDAAETQRVLAKRRSHPVITGSGRVALVEDEVHHPEHRGEPTGELGSAGDLEGDTGLGKGPLGPDDPLGDGRFRDQECARDLLRGRASEQAKREGDTALGREHRMAGYEHETQEVVADRVIDCGIEIGRGHLLLRLELVAKLLVLALQPLASAKQVDGPMLCRGHEPGAWVVRDTRLRPSLQCRDERVLRKVLGNTDVTHHTRETGNEFARLDPPDRVDRSMGIGSRHGYQSDHLLPPVQACPRLGEGTVEHGDLSSTKKSPGPRSRPGANFAIEEFSGYAKSGSPESVRPVTSLRPPACAPAPLAP